MWDPEKIDIIPDHYIFTSDPRANRNVDILRCASAARNEKMCAAIYVSELVVILSRLWAYARDVVKKYGIKYFYDITDRSDFRANPDYKGVCHIALAQEGHCKPGALRWTAFWMVCPNLTMIANRAPICGILHE